jgi:hypothetical protein
MAGSVNKVILVGNLGRDPEVKSMQDGRSLVNMSVATSETWRDRNSGERKERTESQVDRPERPGALYDRGGHSAFRRHAHHARRPQWRR